MKTLLKSTFWISIILAIAVLYVQINYSKYNYIAYIICIMYISLILLTLLFVSYKKNNVNIRAKTFTALVVAFFVSEIPVIYIYRDTNQLLQHGVTRYIQILVFMTIIGSLLIELVRKHNNY